MIDFTATQMDNTETKIEFVNYKGEVVKTYMLSELEDYVIEKELHISNEMRLISGSGIPSDPNNIEEEVEVSMSVSDYIDLKWEKVTEDFYNHHNSDNFKSFNTETQTRKELLL